MLNYVTTRRLSLPQLTGVSIYLSGRCIIQSQRIRLKAQNTMCRGAICVGDLKKVHLHSIQISACNVRTDLVSETTIFCKKSWNRNRNYPRRDVEKVCMFLHFPQAIHAPRQGNASALLLQCLRSHCRQPTECCSGVG